MGGSNWVGGGYHLLSMCPSRLAVGRGQEVSRDGEGGQRDGAKGHLWP